MFFGRISTLLLSFFVSVYMARKLGVDNFGTLNFITSFVAIVGTSIFTIDALILKKLNNEPENAETILGTALVVKIINAVFTVLVVILAAIFFINNRATEVLVLLFSTATIFQSFSIIDLYFQSHANIKKISQIIIVVWLISSIFKVIIVSLDVNLIYLVASYVLDSIMMAIGYIIVYTKNVGAITNWKVKTSMLKFLIIKSWPFTISALATSIYVRVDQVFLKLMLGSSAVGIYSVAVRFSEVWFFISSVICASLLPAILNSQKSNFEQFMSRSKKLYSLLFYLSIFICVMIYFLAPTIVNMLYGADYFASIAILRIYIWSIVGVFVGSALQQILLAQDKMKVIMFINLAGMVFSLTLNSIFIPIWGISGAAIANIFAYMMPVIILFSLSGAKEQRHIFIEAILNPLS